MINVEKQENERKKRRNIRECRIRMGKGRKKMGREEEKEDEKKAQGAWLSSHCILMSVLFRMFIFRFRPHVCNVQICYRSVSSQYL
jgi:hypothetical protein